MRLAPDAEGAYFFLRNTLTAVEVRTQVQMPQIAVQMQHADSNGNGGDGDLALAAAGHQKARPVQRNLPKVGRNDPCPYGSGKKFKDCHGKLT